jgi:drug/metabolite transporter (DMT)-like permease
MKTVSSSRSYAVPALAAMTLFWGYNWVVMKVALRYSGAWFFAAVRSGLAGALLLILVLVLRRRLRTGNVLLTVVVGLVGGAGSSGLGMWALESGGAGKTSVLVFTMPLWLLILSWLVLGEKIRGLQWLCVALGVAGLCFFLEPWSMGGTLLSKLLGIGCGVCSAVSAISCKILVERDKADILSLTMWQMLLGAIPLAVVTVVHQPVAPVWSGAFVGTLLYNVVLANAAGTLLWLYALRALPAGSAGLATLGAPVVGVVAAWIQLGERADSYEVAGMVLVLLTLFVLSVSRFVGGRQRSRQEVLEPALAPAKHPHETEAPSRKGSAHG